MANCAGSMNSLLEVTGGPESLREAVLMDMHEGELGGHLGVDKTISRVKERLVWQLCYLCLLQ